MRPRFAGARATVATCAIGCLASLGAAAFMSSAEAASPTNPAAASTAAWLTRQLVQGQSLMPGLTTGTPDVGLTSDTLLSLVAAGQRQKPEFAASLAAVAGHLSGYASFPAGGKTALLAGPLAKTLFLAEVGDADPTAFGGVNLPAAVRSLLTASVADAGRFSDYATGSDTSNGFSQSFAVLGLSRDPDGVPPSAVSFLLAQQCPSGAFRLFYDTPGGCRDDSQADPDATSMTIQALSALLAPELAPELARDPGQAAISAARTSAARWLATQQRTDGGLGGAGPTAGENANTTALAAVAFRETGLTDAAQKAQGYVARLQLTGGPDMGAVAYNPAVLSTIGRGGTIPRTDEDQWRRSTSQALLAFDLPGYDALPTVPGSPITPVTPTPSAPTPSAPAQSASPLTAPRPAQRAGNAPVPVTSGPSPGVEQLGPAATDFSSDGVDDSTVVDEPGADTGQADEADSPAVSSPIARQSHPLSVANSGIVPLSHTTPQAAVSSNSADGGVPSWVWVAVAAGAGVGGGVVVLRLQSRRAGS